MKDIHYTIRKADCSDIPAMSYLLEELFSIEKDFVADREKQIRGLELLLQGDLNCAFVCEINSEVIGMCTAQLVVSTAQGALSGLIEDMVVTESYRGQGTGRALLDATVQWCLEMGSTRVQLLADKTNQPALDFYSRQSWQSTRMICLNKAL